MASQCKRQQCTIDRRGFRQELDSWRHKLIHCVGFESILDGLFGPELVEDLKLFKDSEPTAVSDWSFDENCLFCCLRRDKVKEHLIGLSDEGIEDTPKPLLFKDQITISRLEKQAEEFLNAVLNRKDVPNFSDPHIPVVAREILQRMIRQFAAEYTSKTSFPQDSSDSQPRSDQSLPTPPLLSGAPPSTSPAANLAGPAHNQNPVLSKLLMADQDAPLDLTIKKPLTLPSDQDGVLDLSVKRSRYSSSSSILPVRSPCLSPATSTLKGEFPDLGFAKAKELQSTSTLEQFMAKLCSHHQRQIVNAIGFLQTEVKALASSNTQQDSKSTSGIEGTACSSEKCSAITLEKSCPDLKFPTESTLKSEAQDLSYSNPLSCGIKVPENVVLLKSPVTAGPALDLRSPASGNNQALVNTTTNPVDTENNRQSDHAPLKMKIMTSNVAAGKKLSCVLNTSLSSHSDSLDGRDSNFNVSNKTETHSARLSSSVKRHNQSGHSIQGRQRETLEHAKDGSAKIFSVHMTIPSDSPRTARKTIRTSSDHRVRDSICRGMTDPDLGHCDIVFIDKPITECFKEQQRSMLPRRNARKSTRGHMYSDEIWELKTVRTLAGRGNYASSMPELITLVTPKQIRSKPEGVPPVDMPFAGACQESMNRQMSTESDMSVTPGTGDMVEVAANDVMVETSQTDQCQSKGRSVPSSLERTPTKSKENDGDTGVEQPELADSGTTTEGAENLPALPEEERDNEPNEDSGENAEKMMQVSVVELVESVAKEPEPQPPSDQLLNSEPSLQENSNPLLLNQAEEEEIRDEQPQDQPEMNCDNWEASNLSSKPNTTGSADELEGSDMKISEKVDGVLPLEPDTSDTNYDVTSKTLDALLKELPPWRRRKGTVISLPKRLKQTESVVVGYVNGRPISASDRSLRRRSSNSTTSPSNTPVKSSCNLLNKTSGDSSAESKNLEKHPVETHIPVKSTEATPVNEPVKEPSSARSSPTSKSRTRQIQKQKRVQGEQDSLSVLSDLSVDPLIPLPPSTESKRQLRSAGQRQAETPALLSTVNADISTLSPQLNATHIPPSGEQLLSLSPPSPLKSEQSHQNPATESSMDVNIEKSQPVETVSKEVENQSLTKQKLRSTKAVENKNESEKLQLCSEVSGPQESPSPLKTEMQMQILPLRSKRILRKETEAGDVSLLQEVAIETSEGRSASGLENSFAISDLPARMPLRSESSKGEMSQQSVTQTPPEENKKLALRSQRLAAPSTSALSVTGMQSDTCSPIRVMPERITKAQVKPPPVSLVSVLPHSSPQPVITPKPEPSRQTPNKFYRTLTGEENQHLITNLNIKYDKMHKGWVQMDKEGQPATKYKNKADRQAAIWKSKRRARKSKSLEHQKYSPVQMLFMKGFNLTSICRWFLESTETKSLVIVKKVNTRLPSETQLCFHSSSSSSGTSQGVFPSLQAERLKKHLKKFAIASPVKCNPKSQKLIAKALEQEANPIKGKERRDPPSTTHNLIKPHSSAEVIPQKGESQKSSGKSKNPASARILRKYSNIREKMQVQQTNVRLKEASKALKTNSLKRLATKKSASKSNLKQSMKAKKSPLPVNKRMKESAAKMEKRKTLAGKKNARLPVQGRPIKAQSSSRASKDKTRKELPKRCSQRLGSPKLSEHNPIDTTKSKVDDKKQTEVEKAEVDKTAASKINAAKTQTKDSSQSSDTEIKGSDNGVETSQQSMDFKVPTSPDQVLTRSQRKTEATGPRSLSPSLASKRVKKSIKTQNASPKPVRKAEEPKLTRSGALMSPAKRRQAALSPRTVTKSATKRARELPETPAKRTRTSLSK